MSNAQPHASSLVGYPISIHRLLAALILTVASISCWIYFYDDYSNIGTAVLGGYRDRCFIFCVLLSWMSVIAFLYLLKIPRETWYKIISVHLGLLIALVFLESAAVFGLIDYRELLSGGQKLYLSATRRDPHLRSASPPNLRVSGKSVGDLTLILGAPAIALPYTFETDALGLRNAENKLDAQVILLGDSILVAGKLPISEILTERLEHDYSIRTLNVSSIGYSPQEELALLEDLGINLNCRLIVQFIFEGNDLTDSRNWRQWRADGSHHYPESGLVKTLLRQLDGPKIKAASGRSGKFNEANGHEAEIYFLYDAGQVVELIDEFGPLSEDLKTSQTALEKKGAKLALVFVPSKLTVLGPVITWPSGSKLSAPALWDSLLPQKVRAYAQQMNIPYHDLTDDLRAAAKKGQLPYFPTDTHLNSLGHRIMAAALAPFLRDLRPSKGCSPGDLHP
jgi:hypothetical protein